MAHNAAKELFRGDPMVDPGASGTITVDRLPAYVPIKSLTTETRTLAAPTRAGAIAILCLRTDGGDVTLTVTGGYDEGGSTTYVFTEIGQYLLLVSIETAVGTYVWRLVTSAVIPGTSVAGQALVLDSNSEINDVGVIKSQDTIIATAAVLALFTTPIQVLPAPATGVYIEFLGAYVFLDYAGTAYAADAGEDLCIKYTDASGDIVSTSIDGEEFEATADALFQMTPVPTAPNIVTHLSATALVAHVLVGNWVTGTSPLKIRVLYREIRKASLEAIA